MTETQGRRRFDGRVALVTGGAQGIGRVTALRFAREGCNVAIVDLLRDKTEETRKEIAALGVRATAQQLDISDVDASRELIERIVAEHGRLDILVNNAAVRQGESFYNVTDDEWDRFFAVNARGTFFLLQAAARRMSEAGFGRVINIASIAARAWWGAPCPPYSASKMAIIAMTRVAALEFGLGNVTVNTICPGLTRTAVYTSFARKKSAETGIPFEDAMREVDSGRMIPMGRSNDPEDIASLITYLASEEARFITGQTFNVDGGLVFESGVSQPNTLGGSATRPPEEGIGVTARSRLE